MHEEDMPGDLPPASRRSRPARPYFSPSHQVHLASTKRQIGTAMWGGPDHWISEGYSLRALVSMLYGIPETRIEFQTIDPNTRYDVALVLPHKEERERQITRIQQTLETNLKLLVSRRRALQSVYVVTAPNGPGPELNSTGVGSSGCATYTVYTLPRGATPSREELEQWVKRTRPSAFPDEFSMSSGTISDLCSFLEGSLDHPVIDESQLIGDFEVRFKRGDRTEQQTFDHFRQAYGLVITPMMREIDSLHIRTQ